MSDGEVDMKIDPARAKALSAQLQAVGERIGKVAGGRNVRHLIPSPPSPIFKCSQAGEEERLMVMCS